MNRWPNQIAALEQTLAAIAAGEKRICITSPTGTGKTVILGDLASHFARLGWCVPIFTNRRLLVEQLMRDLAEQGIPYGVRAAGHAVDPEPAVQICLLPTERSRTLSDRAYWRPHGDGERCLAIVDEAHSNCNPTMKELADHYLCQGGVLVGITATPVALTPMYTHLIVAGTTSLGRSCGALVPAVHYGCDEPDLRLIRRQNAPVPLGVDLTEKEAHDAMMRPTIFGRVMEWLLRLNPTLAPTILFAPSRAASLWFAEQLAFPEQRRPEDRHYPAISAASIDGEKVYCNGETVKTSPEARAAVMEASRTGLVKVICNRFVLREGINMPWLRHGILATVFGSIQSYLQSGGRLLRIAPGKDCVTVQDHGGNYWRHSSLNEDRDWNMAQSATQIASLRAARLREPQKGDPPQPGVCPKCGRVVRLWKCPCGWEAAPYSERSRPVVELDGSLRLMHGDPYQPRRRMAEGERVRRLWEQYYHRATKHKWNPTWLQLEAVFASENGWQYPPRGLPLMPREAGEWANKVRDTPQSRLIPTKREGVLQ